MMFEQKEGNLSELLSYEYCVGESFRLRINPIVYCCLFMYFIYSCSCGFGKRKSFFF